MDKIQNIFATESEWNNPRVVQGSIKLVKFSTGFQLKGYTTSFGICLPNPRQNEGVQCSECALVKSNLCWGCRSCLQSSVHF